MEPVPPRRASAGRQRASHSSEAVISEAVALLDEAGEPALTFRALAARLGGGIAADLGQQPPPEVVDGTMSRDEHIRQFADEWRSLDPEAFPFVHRIVDEFAAHDDTEQFRAGLD